MADNDNTGWESAPSSGGGVIPASAMVLNDAQIQSQHPNWPNGGTAAQIQMESKNRTGQVSPKGALGLAQVEPSTLRNIEADLGRKLNPDDPQDALQIHRYVIMQNMKRFQDDPDAAVAAYNSGWNPSKWNNPETQNYVQGFKDNTGWESAPSQPQQPATPSYSSPQGFAPASDGWETAPSANQQPTSPAKQRALNTLQQGKQVADTMVNATQGVGEMQASMLSGAFGQAAGALHGAATLATGGGFDQAKADYESEINPVTYQPRTPEGQQYTQRAGQMFQAYQDALDQGSVKAMSAIPFIGDELANDPTAIKAAHLVSGIVGNVAPILLGGALHGKAGEVPPVGAPAESVGKIIGDDAAAPSATKPTDFVGPQPEGGGPLQGQPNAGPQRPIIVDTEGKALPAGQEPTMEQLGAEVGRDRYASQLEANKPSVEYNPETGKAVEPAIETRVTNIATDNTEHLDPESGVPHPNEGVETTRAMAPDEFAQAVQTLAEREPDKYSVPVDMDTAYEKYTKILENGLDGLKGYAARFAKAVSDQMKEDKVSNHPVVKANQNRVDSLAAQLADAQTKQVPTAGLQRALDKAQDTLEKSQKNIGKTLGDDPYIPKAQPDGTVNMYTFGHLPTLMKSIGAILKAVHGVVFRTLDRLLPNFSNLDSTAKIFGQGVKNFVNREANRDWSQTVNAKPIQQVSKVAGLRDAVTELNPHAQDELSPEQLKQQFNQATDLSSSKVGNLLRNNLLQGGLMLSDFSRHPLVKYTTDSVAKAFRASDKWARENLLNKQNGLGPMMKRMSLNEFTEIRTLMEAYEGVKEFTEGELRGRGYGDKQIEYYKRSLELSKDAFNKYNATRATLGLPPVDARIAHIAGYFTGDFKQLVRDSEGRLIAVLGHNNRAALGVIAQRFKEMHPQGDTLDMGTPELRRGAGEDNTFHGYMNILAKLGKDNADIQRLLDVYHEQQMAATNKLSQMANRAKFKSNPENTVGGAEGSKIWQSLQKNAQDGGKQQLKYLESVNRWSEFAKAMDKSQKFIEDPEVNAPNAKAVSQRYLDNQMNRNLGDLAKFTNSLTNGFAEITGVGPTQLRGISAFTKTGLLNMFVGLGKFSHSLVTMIQPLLGIPEVNSVLKASGAKFGMAQITSGFKAMMDNATIIDAMARGKQINDPFLRAANQYARDNDTFNTSQFNMGSVSHPSTKLGNALHINVTVPESGARAFTYMYYARMLKDVNDGSLSDKEIFGAAHNAVQKVMADYNREAQAPIFSKMGFLGDLTRMLTTFKMNQISQYATAGKMLSQGKVMPMVTLLGSSLAAAGLRGFIGYNIANGALGMLTTWATKQGMMQQPTNLDQMILHMLHGKNQHLADALNFGATSALGIDMTGSLSHADDIPDDPMGTLIPETPEVFKAVGSAVQLAEHPNTQRAKALLYDISPNSLKGIEENTMFTNEKGQYFDPHTGNLVATRSASDRALRAGTFRPLEESKMRLEAEVARGQNVQLAAVRNEISKRVLSDADSKSLTPESLQNYAKQYVAQGGDPRELVSALEQHMGINKNLNIEQREAGIPRGLTSAEKYQRAQELK